MKLTRKKIQRMVETSTSPGGGTSTFGFATESWVNENYISKAFFARLFVAYDENDDEITPNDAETTVDNIKALVDFWSSGAISALGQGEGGGGGGASALADLNDVTLTSPANGNLLQYNGTHWVNVALATLLTDYATKAWANSTFATIASLSDNATQSWVNSQGFLKTHPASFWGQSWPSDNSAISGDMTNVGDITMNDGYPRTISMGNSCSVAKKTESSTAYIGITAGGVETFKVKSSVVYSTVQIYTAVGVYSAGYVTALSDIRKKDVVSHFCLKVADIAKASLIRFTWKDSDDKTVHAGGIAQEWQKLLPESVVEQEDGTLSMDYGVIGVASAVSLAKEVVAQKQRIDELEKENEALKARLERIEKLLNL